MRIPGKLEDLLGVPLLMSDLVTLNTVRDLVAFIEGQMATGAAEELKLVHRSWPDNARPASVGQQALYAVCLADASGVGVSWISAAVLLWMVPCLVLRACWGWDAMDTVL